jgi:hypothetical protein
MKKCKKCLIEQDDSNFSKNKNNKDGLVNYCKKCEKIRTSNYRIKNREKINLKNKIHRNNNPEKYKEHQKKYLEKNPHMTSKERMRKYRENEEWREKFKESRKKYYLNNIDKEREQIKNYYHKNKETERKKNNEWKKNKLKIDPLERMKKNIRDRIREYLTGDNKSKRTFDIIGLDKQKFKSYIENKFTEGMTWENYGKWHLDHIKPLCLSENEEDLIKLNHYTNLQPLWSEDNIKKNRKYVN